VHQNRPGRVPFIRYVQVPGPPATRQVPFGRAGPVALRLPGMIIGPLPSSKLEIQVVAVAIGPLLSRSRFDRWAPALPGSCIWQLTELHLAQHAAVHSPPTVAAEDKGGGEPGTAKRNLPWRRGSLREPSWTFNQTRFLPRPSAMKAGSAGGPYPTSCRLPQPGFPKHHPVKLTCAMPPRAEFFSTFD
jgi:hypothetical protein